MTVYGVLLGALITPVALKVWADRHYPDDQYNLPFALLVGVPAGGAVGAFVGSRFKTERWSAVPLR